MRRGGAILLYLLKVPTCRLRSLQSDLQQYLLLVRYLFQTFKTRLFLRWFLQRILFPPKTLQTSRGLLLIGPRTEPCKLEATWALTSQNWDVEFHNAGLSAQPIRCSLSGV